MKVICAWCKKEIKEYPNKENVSDFEITHGICKTCKEYFFSDQALTMNQFLNKLNAPVLMVNADGDVLLANDQALQYLDKDLDSVKNLRGGDVMECAYAKLPGGCGNTKHCMACTIRNNINKTFETGNSLRHVPAFLNRLDRNAVHRTEFLISTEKVDDVVLLRIDEVFGEEN